MKRCVTKKTVLRTADEARKTVQVVLWREVREGLPRERCRIGYMDMIAYKNS